MMNSKNQIERITRSVSFKLFIVAFLALLLLIPAQMIKSLIKERQMRRNEVVEEITNKLGKNQQITGPILTIPYLKDEKNEYGNREETLHHLHILPEELIINGKIDPSVRYRSIYEVIGYSANLHFNGTFDSISFQDKSIKAKMILWEDAVIYLGISDMRGIKQNIHLYWNDNTHQFKPGLPSNDVIKKGVHTNVKIESNHSYSFDLDIQLSGSESIQFVPAGSKTIVNLRSNWETPSFSGAYLPDNREVNNNGFKADWQVLELNRTFPQQWDNDQYDVEESAFGVDLLFPVDIYQKNMRSVKYAILFIILTFVVFFFSEYLNKRRIHPIQYLLVGFGIVMFYSLLLSLSEHLPFAYSYLIASLAIIILITSFLHGILKNKKSTLAAGGILTLLYIFLYIILKSFDYSLLIGNIGLFIILAGIMYFSRKIDWNKEQAEG